MLYTCIYMEVLLILIYFQKFFLGTLLLLLFAAMPASATPASENYLQIQESMVLRMAYNGTDLSSAEYMEIVWPQVYEKISAESREVLSNLSHVWELIPLQHGESIGLGFTINDSWGPERLALSDAIERLDITEGEYQAIVHPELYLTMSDDLRKMLSSSLRLTRDPSVHTRETSITEGESQWFSKNVSQNITRLFITLEWESPESDDNELSITIYSPDKCIFGPFSKGGSKSSHKMKITKIISRLNGIAEGEWWYCVKGVKINGTQNYTI